MSPAKSSPKASASHDKLARRLTEILAKLNNGEKLDPQALAVEFNVNLRTVQRDLNERFHFLPLEKSGTCYSLDPAYLGKISLRDVGRFASLAGVRDLFPSLSDDFLRDIFDSRLQTVLLVKGQHFEDLTSKMASFEQLKQAILSKNHITYSYQKSDGVKTYANAEPYKLVNKDSVWYLAAKDGGQLKSFMFSEIDHLQLTTTSG